MVGTEAATWGVITVRARFFAIYRERVGQSTLDVRLDGTPTVGDLVREVVRRYPQLSHNPESVVIAVNQEYAPHGYILSDGDEAAFIPPVSGGSNSKSNGPKQQTSGGATQCSSR